MRTMSALVGLVSRVPARVQVKLLAAFLAIEVLLIVMGAVGLQVLSGVNQRTDELIKLQRKIEAYRQVQHDTTSQLYSVSSALLSSDDLTLSSTLRQLNQFGYNVDRLQFVAKDEVELLDRFRQDYDRFTNVVTNVLELIRAGRASEARELQVAQAVPLADLEAHPRLLDIGELDDRLSDVPRMREALRVLVGDGLATRLGDRVGTSRAAVRFHALGRV